MGEGIGLLMAAALLYVVARHPVPVLVAAASLVVYWDFGLVGLGILWPVLLVAEMQRSRS